MSRGGHALALTHTRNTTIALSFYRTAEKGASAPCAKGSNLENGGKEHEPTGGGLPVGVGEVVVCCARPIVCVRAPKTEEQDADGRRGTETAKQQANQRPDGTLVLFNEIMVLRFEDPS